MNEITPLRPGAMPAHLQSRRLNLNAAAHANLVAGGFPVLSYKGKTWSVKHHGEWELLKGSQGTDHQGRPLPEQPLQYIDVIIVGMATPLSKTYYEKSYGQGDDSAPDCFSVDSIAPDASAPRKQHTSCKVCPKNQWGSRMTDNGKKAKACTDYRRIAVVPSADPENEVFGGPMLLRVPPMSIQTLHTYATRVETLGGADVSQVVTRIGFNPAHAYPSLTFEALGYYNDPAAYETVLAHAESDQVRRMLNEALDQSSGGTNPGHEQAPMNLGPRPAHLAQARPTPQAWAGAVQQENTIQQNLQAAANRPLQEGNAASAANPPVQEAQEASAPAPAPKPVKAAAAAAVAQPVIQGAPDDLEEAVDDLLSGN